MPGLLSASRIEAVADGDWLIRDVSLVLPEGSTVALVGGAAAGKSVLLDLFLGLRPLRGGELRLGGHDLGPLGPLARQQLGLRCAFQSPPLFPGLAVHEHLVLAAASVRLEDSAFQRLAHYFPELDGRLDQLVTDLEPELVRLVDLGRALLGLPRVLMIDNLLPAIGIERASALVRGLEQDGYTLLLADRWTEPALALAGYGYVLAQGRLVAEGRPRELLADPRLLAACAGDPEAYA
jgi:ABC-type branched-subunit amino acid transport system ATPase component